MVQLAHQPVLLLCDLALLHRVRSTANQVIQVEQFINQALFHSFSPSSRFFTINYIDYQSILSRKKESYLQKYRDLRFFSLVGKILPVNYFRLERGPSFEEETRPFPGNSPDRWHVCCSDVPSRRYTRYEQHYSSSQRAGQQNSFLSSAGLSFRCYRRQPGVWRRPGDGWNGASVCNLLGADRLNGERQLQQPDPALF